MFQVVNEARCALCTLVVVPQAVRVESDNGAGLEHVVNLEQYGYALDTISAYYVGLFVTDYESTASAWAVGRCPCCSCRRKTSCAA